MAKKTYVITINDTPKRSDVYRYTYSRTPCDITCSIGRACVTFRMDSKKAFADLVVQEMPIFMDALRKMHLLHFLCHGKALTVKRIRLSVNEETAEFDQECDGFPFLNSMLGDGHSPLPPSFRSREFLETVLSLSKSDIDKDLRCVCLYAFLSAKGRGFEYDRFTST